MKWQKVKLGDVCECLGKGKHPASFSDIKGTYPFIVSGLSEKKCNEYDNDDECFIIGDGGCANIHYVNGKYAASDHTYIFKSKDDRILTKYIYKYLSGNIRILEDGFKGAGIKNISKSYIMSILIPLPPKEEQERIAKELDAVSDLLSKQKQLLTEQDTLIKSVFYDMFGDLSVNDRNWSLKRIKDIAFVKIGPFGSFLHKEDYVQNGHPIINPSHMLKGKIVVDNNFSISDEKYQDLESYQLHIGDIVLGRRGEMGRCAVVNIDGYLCGTGSMIIRPYSEMNSFILQKILSSSLYQKILKDKAVGVTMKNINVKIVEELLVPVIPAHLQQKFVDIVEQIEVQKQKIKLAITETETLFNALMAKYFDEE